MNKVLEKSKTYTLGYDKLISSVLKRMSRKRFHGALPPQKAILLYGVPGNGKTFKAKAIAGELGLNFLQVSGGQLMDK